MADIAAPADLTSCSDPLGWGLPPRGVAPAGYADAVRRACRDYNLSEPRLHTRCAGAGQRPGRAALRAASGLVPVAFGHGLSRCALHRNCSFGIANCGPGSSAGLRGLQVRARFVGPAIFMPHISWADVTAGSGATATVLVGRYCPPAAGDYRVDLRLLWWAPHDTAAQQIFLGGRQGVGATSADAARLRRCEAMSAVPLVGAEPWLRVHAAASPAPPPPPLPLPPCNRNSSLAGHWLRLPEGAPAGPFRGAPEALGEAGGRWSNGGWGAFMGPEEEGHSRWAWASRSCAHRYYTPRSAELCTRQRRLRHILFYGDSQARNLYITAARYLGLPILSDAELKQRMNYEGLATHQVATRREGLELNLAYTWEATEHEWNKTLAPALRRLRPDVVVFNLAVSHNLPVRARGAGKPIDAMPKAFAAWLRARREAGPRPITWVYHRAPALQGQRNPHFTDSLIRRFDEAIARTLSPLGVRLLETELPLLHRFDAMPSDGWHLLMNSTSAMLTANLLFALLCGD